MPTEVSKDRWVFTFGCGQKYPGKYVVYEGTFSEAREQMLRDYGADWCGQYSESQWKTWLADPRRAQCMEQPLREEDRIYA